MRKTFESKKRKKRKAKFEFVFSIYDIKDLIVFGVIPMAAGLEYVA